MFYVGNKPNASIFPPQLSPADEIYWSAAYIENRLRLIKAMNPQRRLVTAHGGLLQSYVCPPELCTMSTQETHFTRPNSMSHTQSIWYKNLTWVRTQQEMPVLMAEFYYEEGPVMPCVGKACVKPRKS